MNPKTWSLAILLKITVVVVQVYLQPEIIFEDSIIPDYCKFEIYICK